MRISTTLLGLGALAAVSCGSPAELDESQFPELDATGYTDGTGGSVGALPSGNSAAGGASGVGGAGTSMMGRGGAPSGGAGVANVPSGGGTPAVAGGAAGASSPPGSGGCPEDITVLFNRPIEQGGCAGGACHIPGATRPDLVSANPEERLLNVQSSCNALPYIGASAEDSFLAMKVTAPPNGCGLAMPFFMPQALGDDDRACILEWIDEITGG